MISRTIMMASDQIIQKLLLVAFVIALFLRQSWVEKSDKDKEGS